MSTGRCFSGVRVVDFTHVLAGPACAYFLGLLGADVIKVESVGRGDAMRHRGGTDAASASDGMSTAYIAQGAGKQSLAVDLDTAAGREIMRRLLDRADVLVENHLPGTAASLGLDEASVARRYPHLVHCAMSGYGRAGPQAHSPAYDVNIQAACGLMAMTGTEASGPMRAGAPVVDYGTALAASFAVSAALYQRVQTGRGTFIDVSMLETALTLMSSTVTDYLATGTAPKRRGNLANSRSPGAGSFPCREGVISLGVNEEPQFAALARVLEREDWLNDPRFAERVTRKRYAAELQVELESALATRSATEWEQEMQAAGVPVAVLRTLEECVSQRVVSERGYLHTLPDGRAVPTLPFRIGGGDAHTPSCPPPECGADSVQVLASLGYSGADIETLLADGVVGQSAPSST